MTGKMSQHQGILSSYKFTNYELSYLQIQRLTLSNFETIVVSVWVFDRDHEVGTSNGVGSNEDASEDSGNDDDEANDGICNLSSVEIPWELVSSFSVRSFAVVEEKEIDEDESTFLTFLVLNSLSISDCF